MPTKIIVADDLHVMRKACVIALQMRPDYEVCAQAANGKETLNAIRFYHPDILLLDLNMPIMDGYEVLENLKGMGDEVKTIVVSMNDHPAIIARCMDLGARGFLSTCNPIDDEPIAIDSVMQNGYYFNEQTNRALLNNLAHLKKFEPHFYNLTVHFDEDELKVLNGYCRQLTAREIAEEICLSQKTVERIKADMVTKLRAKNLMSVVLYAHQKGLIDLDHINIRGKD